MATVPKQASPSIHSGPRTPTYFALTAALVACGQGQIKLVDSEAVAEIETSAFQASIPEEWKVNDVYGTGTLVFIDPVDVAVPAHSEPNSALTVFAKSTTLESTRAELQAQLGDVIETKDITTESGAAGVQLEIECEYLGPHRRAYALVGLGDGTVVATADTDQYSGELDAFVASLREVAR